MEYFVARQPIFDKNLNVFAYELLFRSGLDNVYDAAIDGDQATANTLTTSFLVIGMKELTGGKRAFINFTKSMLEQEIPTLFSKELLSVEILEDVEPDANIISICEKLKRAGYMLVLDDFTMNDIDNPIINLIDILKVDFRGTNESERELIPQIIKTKGLKYLAEKVEDENEFNQCLKWGYSYFQGYFFSKPVVKSGQDIPGYKLTYLRILHEIHKPSLEFNNLELIIKQDVSISYKLFKFINSAFFGFRKINSLKHALVLLGINEIKKWISVITLSGLSINKPEELIVTSLVRAKFLEAIAHVFKLGDQKTELFLMGMFSIINALLDKPMTELLSELPISEEIKIALLGGDNKYRKVFNVALSYEKGDWDKFSSYATELQLDELEIKNHYNETVKWVNQIFKSKTLLD